MADRPQNKNLKAFGSGELTPEEEFAIRSKGGKASQEKRQFRVQQAYLLGKYAGVPLVDKRTKAKFERMGFENEDLVKALEITHAIMTGAKKGDPRMIEIYLKLTGEDQPTIRPKTNNFLEALKESTREDVSTDDLPEIREAAEFDDDMVEPPEV